MSISHHVMQVSTAARLGATLSDKLTLLTLFYSARLRQLRRRLGRPAHQVTNAFTSPTTLRSSQNTLDVLLRVGERVLPWRVRDNGSDIGTLASIFTKREYLLSDLRSQPVRTILDLGGNIGTAALFFAKEYPEAEIASVEADPDNFLLLNHNWSAVQTKGHPLPLAIADHTGTATLQVTDWAGGHVLSEVRGSQVKRELLREVEVPCVDMVTLLDEHLRWPYVDLIKVDIEGYEWPLFRGSPAWLSRVRAVVGEYHDTTPMNEFAKSFRDAGFQFETRSDVPIFAARICPSRERST